MQKSVVTKPVKYIVRVVQQHHQVFNDQKLKVELQHHLVGVRLVVMKRKLLVQLLQARHHQVVVKLLPNDLLKLLPLHLLVILCTHTHCIEVYLTRLFHC
jgi:hypothetical protein